MQKIFFVFVALFIILLFSNGILTKVNTEEVDSSVQASMNIHSQISAHVWVTGIGVTDFVSLPLGDGPFKPKITFFRNTEEEKIFTALVNISKGTDYDVNSFYIQKVVFEGFLAVLNRKALASVANVHDCGTYSIEIHRFFNGITVIYDCIH